MNEPLKNLVPKATPADHPPLLKPKVGVLLSNLGTPDGYDYWSMRRYLGEFLSDRRVIDYSPWLWQPLLQLIILTKRPFFGEAGRIYRISVEKGILVCAKDRCLWLTEVVDSETREDFIDTFTCYENIIEEV